MSDTYGRTSAAAGSTSTWGPAMARAANPLEFVVRRQYEGLSAEPPLSSHRRLFSARLAAASNLYRKDLLAHYGCVNAIEFSQEGELLVSGGDDRRVLLWSVAEAIHGKSDPVAMQTNHFSNIFCLAFDSTNARIFSGGNDDQVIMHDVRTGHQAVKFPHKKPIYGLSVNPHNDNILATAGDDGRILIYDIREPDPFCLAKYKVGFHSVMYNPLNPALLVTANSEEGISLWDARKPKETLIHYDKDAGEVSGISACFNSTGTQVLGLRRRLPPVLYSVDSPNAVCQFYHPQYYNSCTMKTCSFAGQNDEYILSGSDDFNLYMWRIPQENSDWGHCHVVLRGHRSIVNQVRYNKNNNLIASSGVEKMIKMWSTLHIGMWSGSLQKRECGDNPRTVYSHDDYINLVGDTGQRISHDYSDHSVHEDARMMAFFDSLIQREIEGWESRSEDTFTSDSDSDTLVQDRIRLSWQSLLRCRKSAEDSTRKQRPNRISQLIAQKRHRLAKMAHRKCSALVQRNRNREKHKKRKHNSSKKAKSKIGKGISRKSGGKRLRTASPTVNTSEKENHNDNKYESERLRYKKYRTRQSAREYDSQNQSLDVPSTSTGITGSNSAPVFRLVEQQDSDEDLVGPSSSMGAGSSPNGCVDSRLSASAPDQFINILPTPLNGTQDVYINVLEVSNGGTVAASGASVRSSVNDSYENYATSLSDTDIEDLLGRAMFTPVKRRHRTSLTEIDSGFATASSSRASTGANATGSATGVAGRKCDGSSDDDVTAAGGKYERFRKRVKKARLNMRKQIGLDSDSN